MATQPKLPPVADVVSLAVTLHQGGHLTEAEELYSRALEREPRNVDAQHFMGILRHQQGKSDEAIQLIRRALLGNPGYHNARNNLGNVLKETERFAEAETEYRRVIEADANHADALNNLGAVLRAQQKTKDAIETFEQAIEVNPRHADAHQNLGNALKSVGRFQEALTAFRTAVEIDPHHTTAHLNLGRALYVCGRIDEAIIVYRKWLAIEPDNAIAQHMLAACEGTDVPGRCSDEFVRQSFDAFASSFDEVLERLEYKAPTFIAEAISVCFPNADGSMEILDAGCGTGLCSEVLRPYASRLVGIDLSPKMIVRARARELYDELVEAELGAYMSQHPDQFDLIISADTLVYFGELDEVLAAAFGSLRPGGRLVFTVEREASGDDGPGYRLNPHGRYSHRESYLTDCLGRAGLESESISPVVLRREIKRPVDGFVVKARKTC